MISDEDIDDLPDDPDAAFVQYEAIVRQELRRIQRETENLGWDAEREYVAHILAFVDTRRAPLDLPRNPPFGGGEFGDFYQNFVRAVDYYKAAARLQVSARTKANVSVLTLTPDLKMQIGGHLTAIRKIVDEAELSEGKRDAIFRRINNLQEEVDRDRTRTEAAMALLLEVTGAISKGATNLDPALDQVARIVKVFAKAKEENEQKTLSAPQDRKRLPAPTTPLPEAEPPKRRSLDEEIPF